MLLHLLLALRIVTLIPSFAEDVVAIGGRAELVGISKFSQDVPNSAALPVVGDFASVDTERIIALHPDVVVGIPSQASLVAPLRRAGVHVVLMPDDSYDDIFADLRTLGYLMGRSAQAQAEIARLQRQTAQLTAKVPHRLYHPSVFVALGTGPIWTVGPVSYIGHLIVLAGGVDAASGLNAPWAEYSEEALVRAQPDAIVAGHDTDLSAVATQEPWRSLRAMHEGHVFVITDARIDDALFRPGPNYNEGLRWLIERLSSLSTPTTRSGHSNPNSSSSKP
ncbi:MAG TPA: ABC transporter substrate-binding protein [Candidatus Acidoferrum sp.]|nr:ABC transporter substrate-binding protein [Candidatus Acidoferrum sp.]